MSSLKAQWKSNLNFNLNNNKMKEYFTLNLETWIIVIAVQIILVFILLKYIQGKITRKNNDATIAIAWLEDNKDKIDIHIDEAAYLGASDYYWCLTIMSNRCITEKSKTFTGESFIDCVLQAKAWHFWMGKESDNV